MKEEYDGPGVSLLCSLFTNFSRSTIEGLLERTQHSFTDSYNALYELDDLKSMGLEIKTREEMTKQTADDRGTLSYPLLEVHNARLRREIEAISYGPLGRLMNYKRPSLLPTTKFECGCCFDEFFKSELVSCSREHLFCCKCLQAHTEHQAEHENFSIRCMQAAIDDEESCDAMFSNSDIDRALEHPTVRSRFFDLKLKAVSGLVWGEACNQEQGDVHIDDVQTPRPAMKTEQQKLAEEMTALILRYCPGCSVPLEKVGGCNHLKCPRCAVDSCYVCRERISTNYSFHYLGPLACSPYSNAEEDDRRARDELADRRRRQAVARGDLLLATEINELRFRDPMIQERRNAAIRDCLTACCLAAPLIVAAEFVPYLVEQNSCFLFLFYYVMVTNMFLLLNRPPHTVILFWLACLLFVPWSFWVTMHLCMCNNLDSSLAMLGRLVLQGAVMALRRLIPLVGRLSLPLVRQYSSLILQCLEQTIMLGMAT